jgi:hypothetical protein
LHLYHAFAAQNGRIEKVLIGGMDDVPDAIDIHVPDNVLCEQPLFCCAVIVVVQPPSFCLVLVVSAFVGILDHIMEMSDGWRE